MSHKLDKTIIKDYLRTVERTLNSLNHRFGKINYIAAKNSESVPKLGFLDEESSIRYNLHGIGITVDFQDISIVFDFDFHSNNHFGFNAGQLARFIRINPRKYEDLSLLGYGELEELFQNILNELEKTEKITFNPKTKRYYPKENNF